ncbi:ATP/GTP-binding protein [Actinomadura sp. B10D3]|uniref:GTP-binding protein n=1 Tax=Actinomadura sp. B10D3 TaxID=3153557 RepID=UPI00325F3E5D
MGYNESDAFPTQVKILIAGGFGVGKTTFVCAASEIEPLNTEELLTTASIGVDDLRESTDKTTTTVALDFGRITLDQHNIVLYLFGTPGQDRFWFMWDELCAGALGAIVLADTRHLDACFPAIDFFESRGITFVVAVNQFDDAFRYDPDEVRKALELNGPVPIVRCDCRDPRSATSVLRSLVQHLLSATPSPTG